MSYCPRCGRWFSGLAVTFGLAVGITTAAFAGAGLAHADGDADQGRPTATASATDAGGAKASQADAAGNDDHSGVHSAAAPTASDESGDVSDGESDAATDTKGPRSHFVVLADPKSHLSGSSAVPAPEMSDIQASEADDGPSPAGSDSDVNDEPNTEVSTAVAHADSAPDETPGGSAVADAVIDQPKPHNAASASALTATARMVTTRLAAATVAEETGPDSVTGAAAGEPAVAVVPDAATARTVAAAAAVVDTVTVETTEPTAAVATLSTATTTTTTSNWLADLFNSFFLSWQRMFNNATPTVPSQKVNITLADSTGISGPIAFGGTDPDADPLVYAVTSGPKYGTVSINQVTGTFTYDPVDALTVNPITDTFTVKVDDTGFHFHGLLGFLGLDGGHGSTATITVVVGAVNDAPKAVADTISAITNNSVTGNVLTNDTDREGATLTAALATGVAHGALTFATDGSFTYTPNTAFTGQDSFTYTASDGVRASTAATVTITVADIAASSTLTIGVQGLSWWRGLSDADINKALDMSKAAGVSSVRIDISWFVDEATKGTYDWSTTDPLVTKILAHQMTVLGMIYDTPTWLSGSTNPHVPPADPNKFATFAAATAAHYLGKINAWEIWNEQNITPFWTTPDPVAYANLLKAVYPAIKAVNPNAVIVTGGLAPQPGTGIAGAVTYLTAMYAAGAGGYFDAIGLHPYYYPYLPTADAVVAVHTLMTAHGDGNKKIWLTEAGAPTGTSSVAVSQTKQAQTIAMIVDFARKNSYIGPIYLYSLLDTGTDLNDPEDNFGLLRRDFTAKLAWGVWLLDQEDLETLLSSVSSI